MQQLDIRVIIAAHGSVQNAFDAIDALISRQQAMGYPKSIIVLNMGYLAQLHQLLT
jgi:hypothetical protein